MSDMSHIVELHLHLDGSLRPETVWELAKEQGVELPAKSAEEVKYMMEVPEDCKTLEEYLERCLESLLIEDYSLLMNIEVLVINDGSKDCSLKIAHTYETRFPEVFRVIDKANGNWGSCINRAAKEEIGRASCRERV